MDDQKLKKLKQVNNCTVNLLLELGQNTRAERIDKCSSFIERIVIKPRNGGYYCWQNLKVSFCHDKFCAICQEMKRIKLIGKFKSVASYITTNYPSAKLYHITFTVKNSRTLKKEDMQNLNNAFKNLVRRQPVKTHLLGYHRGLEVTYSQSKGYHPHIHVLFAFKSTFSKGRHYLSHKTWTTLWKECLDAVYEPVVNIQEIPNMRYQEVEIKTENGEIIKTNATDAISKLMYYMTKIVVSSNYTDRSKTKEENLMVLSTLFGATHNLKSITDTGIFRDAVKSYNQFVKENKEDFIEEANTSNEQLLSSSNFDFIRLRYNKKKRMHEIITVGSSLQESVHQSIP